MKNTKIGGIGYYVPDNVVTNDDLTQYMDTSDDWIKERTGIRERRYAIKHEETTTTLAAEAAKKAIADAGIQKEDVDFIIFATLSPDYFFPGCGVLLQRELGIGSEMHSMGLDFDTRGRNVTVIFGDGAGAVILQPTEEEGRGVLTTNLHSNGTCAEELAMITPGSHGGHHLGKEQFGFPQDDKPGGIYMTQKMLDDHLIYPNMNGPLVFKWAVQKFPAAIQEALDDTGYKPEDVDMLIPHQANLRISQFVQRLMQLDDSKVFNNIQKYGNTTAASIPIALCEARDLGKIKDGDLVCLAAFGSGFTWGSALIRW